MSDPESLARHVREGDVRLHELEEHADPETAASARRLVVETESDVSLDALATYTFPPAETAGNIENLIGGTQVPTGIAGPIPVEGGEANDEYLLPLATTEGALVAGVNRGCSAVTSAGGATARVIENGMTRAPVFRVAGVEEAVEVANWVRENDGRLAERAESTTNHGELLEIDPYIVGDAIYLRFVYDTKDAMGMNMVTIATREAAELLEEATPASLVALSGNLCSDKKPAAINAIEGRGRTVAADVTIPVEVLAERFDATPAAIEEVNTRKNLVGSAKAGSLGFNAHAANVIAALFLATGQDEAQVVEGANAITTVEDRGDELYVSITLASLEVGTIGGGTGLPTQHEALSILGVDGGGDPPGSNADEFAEIVAAAALAGEVNLLAALAGQHLASAHETFGR